MRVATASRGFCRLVGTTVSHLTPMRLIIMGALRRRLPCIEYELRRSAAARVEAVPWARTGARHARDFEDRAACRATDG
jgi:hypothetical protein